MLRKEKRKEENEDVNMVGGEYRMNIWGFAWGKEKIIFL